MTRPAVPNTLDTDLATLRELLYGRGLPERERGYAALARVEAELARLREERDEDRIAYVNRESILTDEVRQWKHVHDVAAADWRAAEARLGEAHRECVRLQQALTEIASTDFDEPSDFSELGRIAKAALAGPDTPADSHYRERPIEEDFYLDPRGEWVYRWSDERRVLKPADSQEDRA